MLHKPKCGFAEIPALAGFPGVRLVRWRREWDSNPRYGFPHTRFPSVRLKPLGHLSGAPLLKGQESFCKGAARAGCDIYSRYWFPCCFRIDLDLEQAPPGGPDHA